MSKLRTLLQMESEPQGTPVPRMVFMAGCMRSGTSFLVGKLSQHPQILHVGSELNDVWTNLGGAPCSAECSYRDATDFDVQYAQNMGAYFGDYVRQSRRLRRAAMRWRHKRRTGSGRVSYDWDRIICLNKSTHLTNKIRYVKSLFPKSKWIVLIRSIFGNAASTKVFFDRLHSEREMRFTMPQEPNACWTIAHNVNAKVNTGRSYPGDFNTIPEMWMRLNAQLFRDLEHIPADDVVVVPYERLVNNQAEQIQRIFNVLDLHEANGIEADRIAGTQMKAINTTTSGNPLTKWQSHLTGEEIDRIADTVRKHSDTFARINERLNAITTAQGDPFEYPDPVKVIQELRG